MKKIVFALLAIVPIFAQTKVLLFSASTRDASYNKKLISQAAQIVKSQGAAVTVIDLKDYEMPYYDGDLEDASGMPENAKLLRDLMVENNAIVIATPEYNGSIPGILKNALDWISRDQTRVAFKGKKFAIMSASPSGYGGARALTHLRALIEELGGTVIEKQTTVSKAYQAFNDKNLLENGADLQAEMKQIF